MCDVTQKEKKLLESHLPRMRLRALYIYVYIWMSHEPSISIYEIRGVFLTEDETSRSIYICIYTHYMYIYTYIYQITYDIYIYMYIYIFALLWNSWLITVFKDDLTNEDIRDLDALQFMTQMLTRLILRSSDSHSWEILTRLILENNDGRLRFSLAHSRLRFLIRGSWDI